MAFQKLFGAMVTSALVVAIGGNSCASMEISTPEAVPTIDAAPVAEQLQDIIDHTDFGDTYSIQQMGETIATVGQDLAGEYDGTFEQAYVRYVVDGDTIVVNIDGEGDCKIRMIGINTPESVASQEYLDRTGKENTEEGHIASDFTKSLLEEGEIVYLQKDTSETDKYDRLLRYVWLEIPDDSMSFEEVSEKMVNGILVKEGYAEAIYYAPDGMYKDYFDTLEEEAGVFDKD